MFGASRYLAQRYELERDVKDLYLELMEIFESRLQRETDELTKRVLLKRKDSYERGLNQFQLTLLELRS
jgi:hypothetical protein